MCTPRVFSQCVFVTACSVREYIFICRVYIVSVTCGSAVHRVAAQVKPRL